MTTRLTAALEADEGFRAVPYLDTEKCWTVGIGTCLERITITPEQWKQLLDAGHIEVRLTHDGALLLLEAQVSRISHTLAGLLPDWFAIEEPRRDVLVQMAYQLGVGFIGKFPRFIAAVNARDWTLARVHGLNSKWARVQTPARAQRLMQKLEAGSW